MSRKRNAEWKNKKLFLKTKKRIWICSAAGGLFIGFCAWWGSQLDRLGNVNITAAFTWIAPLGTACIITPVLALIFSLAGRKRHEVQEIPEKSRKKHDWMPEERWGAMQPPVRILLRALALFLLWLPVFLAVYPGFFAYDATDEFNEVLTGEYVTRHPLLHVLMLGKTVTAFYDLTGSFNIGIAVYVLLQMVIMSLLCSWVLEELENIGAGKLLRIFSFFFFGIFPVIPMYVLCTSKDMPYTAGLFVLLILLQKMCREKDIFWRKRLQVLGLGTALFVTAVFRSNGMGVFFLTIPMLVWLAGKKMRRRALTVAAAVLASCSIMQGAMNTVLKPESTNAMEGFTVPIQQMARTWNYSPENFSGEDRDLLFEILPEESLAMYQPKLSDPVKAGFDAEAFQENPAGYARLWLKIGLKSPMSYLNAWLMTSYGFWYPNTVIDVYNGWREYSESSYFSCETEAPGERHSYFPWLERQYEKISWEKEIHETPVISWLFSPGALCWVWILGGLCLIAVGKKREAAALLPVYFNFLTVLIGPTYLVRYVLIFWFGLPVLLSILSGLWYTSKETPGYCSNQS